MCNQWDVWFSFLLRFITDSVRNIGSGQSQDEPEGFADVQGQ